MRALDEKMPISVGTGIALSESLYNDEVQNPKAMYLNLRTLFRNFWGSFEGLPPAGTDGLKAFLDEIETIKSNIEQQKVAVYIYYPTYEGLRMMFPRATLVEPNTDKQKAYKYNEKLYCGLALSELPFLDKVDFRIDGCSGLTYMISNHPVDLLNWYKFDDLHLLESQTGKVKPRSKWFSKLNKKEDLSHLPFNSTTMQVFGDGTVDFRPQGIKVKKALIELSVKHRWDTGTTVTRIRQNITDMSDSPEKETLLGLSKLTEF